MALAPGNAAERGRGPMDTALTRRWMEVAQRQSAPLPVHPSIPRTASSQFSSNSVCPPRPPSTAQGLRRHQRQATDAGAPRADGRKPTAYLEGRSKVMRSRVTWHFARDAKVTCRCDDVRFAQLISTAATTAATTKHACPSHFGALDSGLRAPRRLLKQPGNLLLVFCCVVRVRRRTDGH